MKPLVIYHANCTDGFTAAWCFHHAMWDQCDYHPGVYSQDPPDVTGRVVYLVDFTYPRKVLLGMAAVAEKIIVLDHHKTALEDLEGVAEEAAVVGGDIEVVFDMERSGAGITWDYLTKGTPRPAFLDRVEDRDLWRFKFDNSREVHAFMAQLDYDFAQWDALEAMEDLNHVTLIGATLLRAHNQNVKAAVSMSTRPMTIGGVTVPVANASHNLASDVGATLAKQAPFGASYYDSEKFRTFSLRSIKGDPMAADVAKIAEQYGGGGHANAAGFRVPRDHELARA